MNRPRPATLPTGLPGRATAARRARWSTAPGRVTLATGLGALSLLLASCSAATAPGTTATGGSPASGSLSAASITTIAAYTKSTPGKADSSMKPVTWGYVNQEGGVPAFPAYTKQVQLLVEAVNAQLGGIGGHPLKLDVCHVVSSDEEGQTCGQQFANNKDVSAILQFPLINGDASFHRVVDPTGVPVFGPSANSIDDATPLNDFFTTGPNFSNVPVIAAYAANTLKAKNVAILAVQGDALTQLISGQLTAAFKAAGVASKVATVSTSSSDVTAPLVAAGVQSADAIVATLPAAPLCANVAKALPGLGASKVPVISTAFCGSEDTKAILGDYPTWTFVSGYPDPRVPASSARESSELAVASDLWKATGSAKGELDFASPTAQAFLTALAIVNKAGGAGATTDSVKTAAHGFTGPLFLGEDTVSWGKNPALPAVGTLAQRVFTYKGNGTWVDSGNGWFAPPAGP